MWPFKKRPRTKSMVKVVLTHGQVLVGEENEVFVGTDWICDRRKDKVTVLYPHSRVRRILLWTKKVD